MFNFFPNDAPARGLEELVGRYRELTPYIKLSGPTSFAPAIYQACWGSGCLGTILSALCSCPKGARGGKSWLEGKGS